MEWLSFREPVNTWTHLTWAILAVPGTALLWHRSRGDRPKQISMLVFGLTMIACFGCSALFHGLRLPEEQLDVYVTLDHVGIFLLIAGTCTPVAFTLLGPRWRWSILSAIWLTALVGIVTRAANLTMPPWFWTMLYLTMGWGLLSCFRELARALPLLALRLLVLGGVWYSCGALAYVLDWPVLWPGVIHSHELLHLFDMAGSMTFFYFMVRHVAPFDRREYRAKTRPVRPVRVQVEGAVS
ncbi:MAG: hemolysin III family protein [Gemmataceae bacterium]|nr:hemolysin III family protein [Gemmataceae bacterium]